MHVCVLKSLLNQSRPLASVQLGNRCVCVQDGAGFLGRSDLCF